MKKIKPFYRKNVLLITAFLVLVAGSLITALILAYGLTRKYVDSELSSKKIDVLEETIRPYNDFFQNKIPEISFYQGFLDSGSVVKYVDTVFLNYKFVSSVVFYDVEITNTPVNNGFRVNNFTMAPKEVYQFGRNATRDSVLLYQRTSRNNLSLRTTSEFNKIAIKFSGFIESLDTLRALNNNDIFNIFYSITPNRITYMNIPRREELRIFKDLLLGPEISPASYQQDVLTFYLNPLDLDIKNTHRNLYENVSIKPLIYENLDAGEELFTTDIPLPGAFSEYKLYFTSSRAHINREIGRRFLPIGLSLLLIYVILGLIAFLIYRNLNINRKLFKLQYDFINNLTHEFKTPVSVIKIAGNNIRSAREISDTERKHYGKILDEEADKLNDLMNKLLSFTQIESKSIQIKEEVINLEVFVQNVIDEYEIKYPNYNINYQFMSKIEYFKTDPVLLSSLFHNFIENAYKYSLPDKKNLSILIGKQKKFIVFKFKDKGIGIPNNELDNIFKKFYRVNNEFNQQGSVGLGLAFCKELVNFMNGSITVKSKVGGGSEFTVTLPYEM